MTGGDDQPISSIEIGQFSTSYEDLPEIEGTRQFSDGKMYRSDRNPRLVYVYRESPEPHWDRFVWN